MLNAHFKEAFPRETDKERNLFRLLHRAYIDAQYKMDKYQITKTNLIYLGEQVKSLQKLTQNIYKKRLISLVKTLK